MAVRTTLGIEPLPGDTPDRSQAGFARPTVDFSRQEARPFPVRRVRVLYGRDFVSRTTG